MKVKFFAVLAALLMVGAVAIPATAQDAVTNDVIFLRLGYIPNYSVTWTDDGPDKDAEFTGFAGIGEYNLNLGVMWLAFGLEYQRVVDEEALTTEKITAQFLIPQVTAKLVTGGGFYIGAGLAGKYNISSDTGDLDFDFDKKVDLWGNIVVGYFMPISEGVYLDVQGRFGYNLTNQQWDSGEESTGATSDGLVDSAYDIAIYVGIGFRGLASGL